jgi:hypothetical protein
MYVRYQIMAAVGSGKCRSVVLCVQTYRNNRFSETFVYFRRLGVTELVGLGKPHWADIELVLPSNLGHDLKVKSKAIP